MGSSMVEYVINKNNVIQRYCKPGKNNLLSTVPISEDVPGDLQSEKSLYVHADLKWPCFWTDFLGRNQCCTLQPMILAVCGLWDSM